MNRDEVREMITDLRGGIPEQCDSCAGKFEQDQLNPVSGDWWLCPDCLALLFSEPPTP